MASDLTRVSISAQQASTEFELLQVLLQDTEAYPWDPSKVDDSEYLGAIEANWTEELSADEQAAIASNGQRFFQQLEQAWPDAAESSQVSPAPSLSDGLAAIQATLAEKFQDRVPSDLIQQLTQQAQELASQPLSLADKLVQCVQDTLPGWGQDDLHVLARPYAFAMRGPETDKLEVALRSVRYAAWTELSGVEQARLSLAIARYTLSQMPTNTSGQ